MRMSWGDGFSFSAIAVVASLKNLIYFVYLVVEWDSNLIIDKMLKSEKDASENSTHFFYFSWLSCSFEDHQLLNFIFNVKIL